MVNSFHFFQCRQYNFFDDHITSRRLYEQVWSSEYANIDDKIGINMNAVAERRIDKNEGMERKPFLPNCLFYLKKEQEHRQTSN